MSDALIHEPVSGGLRVEDGGLLPIQHCEVLFHFTHGELVMELAVAVGQFPRGWPGTAEMRSANAAHRGRFDQFEPILHTL